MREALRLAGTSAGLASPNPPVGCVLVRREEVVGRGWHEYAGMDHAEVRALAEAGSRAREATAYVTLEPCAHFGRTPPCVSALIAAGVSRVVIASVDPNPLVSGKGIEALRAAGVRVEAGLFEEEAGRIIEPFSCHVSTGLPLVVGKVGMSLDGRISPAGHPGGRITSIEGQNFGQGLRLQLDALLVGSGTILADNPRLSYRGRLPKAKPILAVVLDSFLRTPAEARIFEPGPAGRVLIFCAPEAPVEHRVRLEDRGAEVLPVTSGPRGLDLGPILEELGRRGVLGLLVEGGSKVHWSFLSAGLADKFYFIVAPIVLGGEDAVPAVGGPGFTSAESAPRFRIRRKLRAGPDLILEAYPSCSRSILSPWREGSR